MAKDNISINSSAIAEIKANAVTLSRQIDTTQKELQELQKKLDGNLSTLEQYIGMCYNKVIPIKSLQKQKDMMNGVVTLLDQAAELAESANYDLSKRADQLKLIIKGIAASIMTSIISIVTRGSDVGDQKVDVVNTTPPEQIMNEMKECYQRTLQRTKRKTFSGACSAFVWRQLEDLGVFCYGKDAGVASGKDYYSDWSKKSVTSTGYQVESYGGGNGLLDLITIHSGKPIKNIVVSFDCDGINYKDSAGHVLLISEIRDGKVFYMESAGGKLYNLDGRRYSEGEPICLSVTDFMKQYPGMNGVVHFYQ